MEAPTNPAGCCEDEMVLCSCFELGQDDQVMISTSVIGGRPPKEGKMVLGKVTKEVPKDG